jgi:hypothetical protein
MNIMNIPTTKFVRAPFAVHAVQITEDNMAEIAEVIGEIGVGKDNAPCIVVNKKVVPVINRAYVGWWLTKYGDNFRCYSPEHFADQFIHHTEGWDAWLPADAEEVVEADPTPAGGTERPSQGLGLAVD